ncbi:hypothetical protein GCM10023192_58940 [Amycolatopsis samaneae]
MIRKRKADGCVAGSVVVSGANRNPADSAARPSPEGMAMPGMSCPDVGAAELAGPPWSIPDIPSPLEQAVASRPAAVTTASRIIEREEGREKTGITKCLSTKDTRRTRAR